MKTIVPFLRRRFVLMAAASVLLAAGCKRSDSDSGGGGGSTAAIHVGEFASLTGSEAAFGQSSHKGTELAVEEINQTGGVLGRPIELITEDNQSKAGESATIAKKLISRDQVVAILGEVAS